MVDVLSLVIGFSVGIVVVGLALEIGMKKISHNTPASKHAKSWDISEISNPRIMAEYLSDVEIPKNSKVIVNKCKNMNVLEGINAKQSTGIKGNFIIGDDRALILAGPVNKNEVGFWTIEKDIVKKLNEEFDQHWEQATTMHQGKEN